MSGRIFMSAEESEGPAWNPLQCQICEEQYRDPRTLHCYHSFCAHCLEQKLEAGNVECHVCGSVTEVGEDDELPPSDLLLKFLVETSAGEKVVCANCDKSCDQMYFCNTCCQSLCGSCREETHRAKMFTKHDVVLHTKHTRDIQKECRVHCEPYILFSTEKKLMLCINCFRDMKIESRSHCVDLDTAYKQSFHKLDDAMQSIRDLQTSVRDGILLLHALLEEVECNVGKEKQAILELYDTMVDKISETKEAMLTEIDRQYVEKEEMFKNQLVSLTTFLPTLRTHLVTCAAFCGSANKYEFLDFTYVLMKRLTAIIQVQHPLHPSQTSDIITDFKCNFAKCLEPLLFPPRNGLTAVLPSSSIAASVACTRSELSPCINSTSMSSLSGGLYSKSCGGGGRNSQDSTKFKLKLCENEGFFSDHCKEFDEAHRDLMQTVEGLKITVQELQRDITIRRSLSKDSSFAELMKKVGVTEERLNTHQINVEAKQPGLEKHWEECLERIAGEQDVYRAQLQDVCRLKGEVESVRTIAQRLSSFMSSIANVTQRLAPKLSAANVALDQDMQHAALLQEISTMQPDSQQRVDAIKTTHEQIDHKKANRTNPLDEELIKTKGLLRAPSARKESSKRSSMEIREDDDDIFGIDKATSNLSAMTLLKEKLNSEIRSTAGVLNAARDSLKGNGDKKEMAEDSFIGAESGLRDMDDKDKDNEDEQKDDCSNSEFVSFVSENGLHAGSIESSSQDMVDELNDGSISSSVESDSFSSDLVMNSSIDSASDQTDDIKPKPGLVKDLIAKVDNIGKQTQNPKSDSKEVDRLNSSVVLSDSSVDNGDDQDVKIGDVKSPAKLRPCVSPRAFKTEDERPKQKPCEEGSTNGHSNHEDTENRQDLKSMGKDKNADTSGESSADKVDERTTNGGDKEMDTIVVGEDGGEGEDVYITKSLPELAQVFEPGELKRKKRGTKSDKSKASKDK